MGMAPKPPLPTDAVMRKVALKAAHARFRTGGVFEVVDGAHVDVASREQADVDPSPLGVVHGRPVGRDVVVYGELAPHWAVSELAPHLPQPRDGERRVAYVKRLIRDRSPFPQQLRLFRSIATTRCSDCP